MVVYIDDGSKLRFIRFIFSQQPLLPSWVSSKKMNRPHTQKKMNNIENDAPSYEELVLELARQVKFNEVDEEKTESFFPDTGDS